MLLVAELSVLSSRVPAPIACHFFQKKKRDQILTHARPDSMTVSLPLRLENSWPQQCQNPSNKCLSFGLDPPRGRRVEKRQNSVCTNCAHHGFLKGGVFLYNFDGGPMLLNFYGPNFVPKISASPETPFFIVLRALKRTLRTRKCPNLKYLHNRWIVAFFVPKFQPRIEQPRGANSFCNVR